MTVAVRVSRPIPETSFSRRVDIEGIPGGGGGGGGGGRHHHMYYSVVHKSKCSKAQQAVCLVGHGVYGVY